METIYKGIDPGTEIVDKDGHKVGTVHEVICNAADQLQLLVVQKGLIFHTDVGVPATAIDRVEGGKIYLSVEKGTLTEMLRPDQSVDPRPASAEADAALVDDGTLERLPNQVSVQSGVMHDVGTGERTHDLGLGTAGVPATAGGNVNVSTGPYGNPDPSLSQEPTSRDRT